MVSWVSPDILHTHNFETKANTNYTEHCSISKWVYKENFQEQFVDHDA